MLDISGDIA